jgi:hypothetical protein
MFASQSQPQTNAANPNPVLLDKPGIRVCKDTHGSFYEVKIIFDTRPMTTKEEKTDIDPVLTFLSSHAFLETLLGHLLTHFCVKCERQVLDANRSSMFVLFAPFFKDLGIPQKFMSVHMHQMILRECNSSGRNVTQVYQFIERADLPVEHAPEALAQEWEQCAFHSMQVWFQRKPITTMSPGIEVTMKIFVPDMDTDEAQLMEKLTCLLLHKVYKKVNDYIQSL